MNIGAISISAAFANARLLYGSDKINSLYISAFERAASSEEIAYWEGSGFDFVEISIGVMIWRLYQKSHEFWILKIGPFAYDF